MKIKRIIAAICCVVMCLALMTACDVVNNTEVMSVGSAKITAGEFRFYLDLTKMMQAQSFGISDYTDSSAWESVEIDGQKAIDVLKDKIKEELTNYLVCANKAQELGLSIDKADKTNISSTVDYIKQYYGGDAQFNAKLSECETDIDTVKKLFEKMYIVNKVNSYLIENDTTVSEISDEDLNTAYIDYSNKIKENALFVKHILIGMGETSATGLSRDEALAKANDICNQIKGGADFEKLMKEFSEDGETSYEGYNFTHGDGTMVTEFDDASYALAVGEVSEPVESQFGFHIIKRYPSESTVSSLDEIKDTLISDIQYERIDSVIEKWKEEVEVKLDEKEYSKIK